MRVRSSAKNRLRRSSTLAQPRLIPGEYRTSLSVTITCGWTPPVTARPAHPRRRVSRCDGSPHAPPLTLDALLLQLIAARGQPTHCWPVRRRPFLAGMLASCPEPVSLIHPGATPTDGLRFLTESGSSYRVAGRALHRVNPPTVAVGGVERASAQTETQWADQPSATGTRARNSTVRRTS